MPNEYQVTKQNISEILRGFQRSPGSAEGYDIYTVRGWDYPSLCETYLRAAETVRRDHIPAILHVTEMTQPQGHSTSGSHERYKTNERLTWETEFDCLTQMRQWMIEHDLATGEELDEIERLERVRGERPVRQASAFEVLPRGHRSTSETSCSSRCSASWSKIKKRD